MTDDNTIPLEEFVSSALLQISRAVSTAAPEIETLGGELNPELFGDTSDYLKARIMRSGGHLVATLDFDVAVTATRGKQKEAGIGVVFAALGAGLKEKADSLNRTVSRISFKVPIRFPTK